MNHVDKQLIEEGLNEIEEERLDDIRNFTFGGIVKYWLYQEKLDKIDEFLKKYNHKSCKKCSTLKVMTETGSSCRLYDKPSKCKEAELEVFENKKNLLSSEFNIKKINGKSLSKFTIEI